MWLLVWWMLVVGCWLLAAAALRRHEQSEREAYMNPLPWKGRVWKPVRAEGVEGTLSLISRYRRRQGDDDQNATPCYANIAYRIQPHRQIISQPGAKQIIFNSIRKKLAIVLKEFWQYQAVKKNTWSPLTYHL